MILTLPKATGILLVALFFASRAVAQVGTPAVAQVETPRHWESQQPLSIQAPRDSLYVIEFLLLRENVRSTSLPSFEIDLSNVAFGFLTLDSLGNSNFSLAKSVKFVLRPRETLTIKIPWGGALPLSSSVYASGYAQKSP